MFSATADMVIISDANYILTPENRTLGQHTVRSQYALYFHIYIQSILSSAV